MYLTSSIYKQKSYCSFEVILLKCYTVFKEFFTFDNALLSYFISATQKSSTSIKSSSLVLIIYIFNLSFRSRSVSPVSPDYSVNILVPIAIISSCSSSLEKPFTDSSESYLSILSKSSIFPDFLC